MIFRDANTPQEKTMLRLTPNEVLAFPYGEPNECILDIVCTAKFPVTYKIQTTSPEKFRVRPRCGVILPGEQIAINVVLKPEHKLAEANKDKFLVMAIPFPDDHDGNLQQLQELWRCKQMANSAEIENHRLCCQYKNEGQPANDMNLQDDFSMDTVQLLNANLLQMGRKLERQLRNTQILQYLILILICLLGMAIGYLLKLEIYGHDVEGSALHSDSGDVQCPMKPLHQ